MKRKDLTVGLEVYYSARNDWDSPTYGTGHGFKAVVKEVEPYSDKYPVWSRTYEPYKVDKGTGVLVEVEGWDGRPGARVVPLSHLRGLYAETIAQLTEYAARRDDQQAALKRAEQAREEKIEDLAETFKTLGYDRPLYTSRDGYDIKLPLDLVTKMAEALHAAGWTYSK